MLLSTVTSQNIFDNAVTAVQLTCGSHCDDMTPWAGSTVISHSQSILISSVTVQTSEYIAPGKATRKGFVQDVRWISHSWLCELIIALYNSLLLAQPV